MVAQAGSLPDAIGWSNGLSAVGYYFTWVIQIHYSGAQWVIMDYYFYPGEVFAF